MTHNDTLLQEFISLGFVCTNIVFVLCGYDKPQMNETIMSTVASHIPAGTSSFTILHYGQEFNHKDYYFGGMDWGNDRDNEFHHGSKTPPIYDPHQINTKV